MNPTYTRVTLMRSGFRNSVTRRSPEQRDFFRLRQITARQRAVEASPFSQMNLHGKVVGEEQALDYLAVRQA